MKKKVEAERRGADLAEEDLDIDEDGDSPDNDVDLGGDDDLGIVGADERGRAGHLMRWLASAGCPANFPLAIFEGRERRLPGLVSPASQPWLANGTRAAY